MADGNQTFKRGSRKSMRIVLQSEAAECGLACLAMIASYHGHDIDLASLRARFGGSLKGMTLARMIEVARALQLDGRPLRAEPEYLRQLNSPCILHWDLNHFVVLKGFSSKGADIFDPARGHRVIGDQELSRHFTGVLLELEPTTGFSPVVERRRISLRALAGRVRGLGAIAAQVVVLAIALEVLALAIPFQLQWVVDQVLVTRDIDLLWLLAIGFLFVVGLQTALSIARGWVVSWFGATLDVQWATNLFGHLLQLPLSYFEKRHMGDIVSRFGSLRSIQTTLTGAFIEALLDGVFGLLALVILIAYSPQMALIVALFVATYTAARFLAYRKLRDMYEEKLVFAAKQQTELMESVRGIQPIKLANKQAERRARFANATLQTADRELRTQRVTMTFGAINRGLFGLQRVVLISIGAALALRGGFSAGMLVAFVAYADQFSQKSGGLVDKAIDLRMLVLHAERISDIALEPPESNVDGTYSGPDPAMEIKLENVSFRYSEDEPWVLQGVNLTVREGECLGVYGPSGCGKTTLVKLVLGLLEPTSGRVAIGGIGIKEFGLAKYRAMLGVVTQDDQLFAGTIAQNISFFDEDASIDRVVRAARISAIDAEIAAMPMGFETLVGDMGSSLSGGQKQRIILARALYRSPRLLVLDEATSHLDGANATRIDEEVRRMHITRLVISHNEETIARSDRQFRLGVIGPATGSTEFVTGGDEMALAEKPLIE